MVIHSTVPSEATEAPARGNERILLVEDEPSVRVLLATALRRHGYTVVEAADGERALDEFRRREGPIGLVVTDVVMPGMSGPTLIEQLATLSPGLRALYMSGYIDTTLPRDAAFIHKPFTPVALARKVREVLDVD